MVAQVLQRPTLVLNRNWQPVNVASVARALVLVWNESAKVVPEVITLTRFSKLPTATVPFSRRNLFKRDRYTCQYCNKRPRQDELTIDHVVPRSHGGGSTWENCVLACIDCNHRKADRTPKQAHLTLKQEPLRPKWNPVYSRYETRYESWAKFISDAYWNAELEE